MHRFFVLQENFQGEQVILAGKLTHQICNVLRLGPGDHIIVLDNTGSEYTVALTEVGRQQVLGKVMYKLPVQTEPRTQITLYQGLSSREKFEWVLQKCTEVGVTYFVPVITERSIVRRPDTITAHKLSRWRRIITEAAEQSGRGRIPQLEAPINFTDAVSRLVNFDRCLIGTLGTAGRSIKEVLQFGKTEPVRQWRIALFVGPEGGFTDNEMQLAKAKGVTPVSLGRRILRTETAAVVVSAIILYEMGELMPKRGFGQ